MSESIYVKKGDRITARWLKTKLSSLAGMQAKSGAKEVSVSGVVRHIRTDRPEPPCVVRIYVETDDKSGAVCEECGVPEVEVDPLHVTSHDPA
jgi:hypothetical protein